MIDRSLKGKVNEAVLRTLEDMDRRLTQMISDLATMKSSSNGNGGGLNALALQQVAGLIALRSQSVIGQDIPDPSLPGQVGATGTVTSITVTAGTNLAGGGTVTSTGTVTLNLSADPSVTTVDATTSYKVGGTKVVGAQGLAVADATGAGDVVAQLNSLLARIRAHGLIAT